MLSAKIFNMVESVCRLVKKNNQAFGGIQVLVSGDFKQLPPVPNYRLGDEGKYCFESEIFQQTFHHHINLPKVMRQHEEDLIKAVNELCNGSPSAETLQLMKSLDRPLDPGDDHIEIVRLFGTNFDASFVNQEMLEDMEGEMHVFKAKDEGYLKLLRGNAVPKTLTVKIGAPVILLKNIGNGLFNGMRGKVHSISKENLPIIDFHGRMITVSPVRFDIFDAQQQKSLASRRQIPLMLAFALTVHRAQGQTIEKLEIDCHSFFAPGQMGVAVGRARNKTGLCIRNFNRKAANLKHPQCVYDFYDNVEQFQNPVDDCCWADIVCEDLLPLDTEGPSSTQTYETDPEEPGPSELPAEATPKSKVESPWSLEEFSLHNKDAKCTYNIQSDVIKKLKGHMNWLYEIITDILKDSPKTRQKWTTAFDQLNNFLVSDNHITSIKTLFSVDTITKANNKLSSKLAFWLMDKVIENEAKKVQQTQEEELHQETPPPQLSQAAKGKIRYIAGACVNKIETRLQKSVVSKLSQCTAKSKISRTLDYRKQRMLKTFRINESEVDDSEPSMAEIDFKQGLSHGLYVVSDDVFNFFIKLHDVVQSTLTEAQFHLHFDNIHLNCRSAVDASDLLLDKWIDLFGEIDDTQMEDEIFLNLVMELYKDITEYFLKVSIADALKNCKATVPRKKKQALRVKLTALGEKKNPKKQKLEEINTEQASYICHLCNEICDWDPADIGDESIACDTCNRWCHYKCVDIEGTETFLKRKNAKWYCPNCIKGKAREKAGGKKVQRIKCKKYMSFLFLCYFCNLIDSTVSSLGHRLNEISQLWAKQEWTSMHD